MNVADFGNVSVEYAQQINAQKRQSAASPKKQQAPRHGQDTAKQQQKNIKEMNTLLRLWGNSFNKHFEDFKRSCFWSALSRHNVLKAIEEEITATFEGKRNQLWETMSDTMRQGQKEKPEKDTLRITDCNMRKGMYSSNEHKIQYNLPERVLVCIQLHFEESL